MKPFGAYWQTVSLSFSMVIVSVFIQPLLSSPENAGVRVSLPDIDIGELPLSEYDYMDDTGGKEGYEEVTYTAAVLEYEPFFSWDDERMGFGILEDNANNIIEYASKAREQGAVIMVTPEYGIQTLNIRDYANDTETFLTFTLLVPDPASKIVPCHYEESIDYFETMKTLSCKAQELEMYLVIDLTEAYPCAENTVTIAPWEIETNVDCPEGGFFFYNTQVVFDSNGEVIARYRKQHLFNEDQLTPGPSQDDTAIFYADFNVLFTLQICFDIVFEDPSYNNVRNLGIRDVVMSTAWVDYLPFYLANSVQNNWSRGLNANLLVSGYHNPENSKLGSGIYKGYAQDLPVYTYNKDSGSKLLVSNVTTISASSLAAGPSKKKNNVPYSQLHWSDTESVEYSFFSENEAEEDRTHFMLHMNLENYTSEQLNTTEFNTSKTVSLCSDNEFCCELTYKYSGNLTYMFIVYSGHFAAGGRYPVGVQNCAVIWCLTSVINSCAFVERGLPDSDEFGPFTISSNSFTSEFIYPGGNHRDLTLISNDIVHFNAEETGSYVIAVDEPVGDLLFSGFCGRWYSNDGF